MSTTKKEKKPVVFAPSIATIVNAFLTKATDEETWKTMFFEEKEKKMQLTIARYNTLTNAFPVRRKHVEESDPSAATARPRKNANAYFYTIVVRSVIFNNVDRTYLLGVDKVWRLEGELPVEIDVPEYNTLEQCVKDAIETTETTISCFKKSRSKVKEEEEEAEEEAEEEEEHDAEYDGLVEDDEGDEEEDEEEEEGDEPEPKRIKLDTAILTALHQNVECQKSMMELMQVQTDVLRMVLDGIAKK